MKHELCAEELARHWSLSFSDLDFINAKPMVGRHALAVQLKYFTANGSFAQSAHDIPAEANAYLGSAQVRGRIVR